jgi:hypothetical protein
MRDAIPIPWLQESMLRIVYAKRTAIAVCGCRSRTHVVFCGINIASPCCALAKAEQCQKRARTCPAPTVSGSWWSRCTVYVPGQSFHHGGAASKIASPSLWWSRSRKRNLERVALAHEWRSVMAQGRQKRADSQRTAKRRWRAGFHVGASRLRLAAGKMGCLLLRATKQKRAVAEANFEWHS